MARSKGCDRFDPEGSVPMDEAQHNPPLLFMHGTVRFTWYRLSDTSTHPNQLTVQNRESIEVQHIWSKTTDFGLPSMSTLVDLFRQQLLCVTHILSPR